MGCRTHQTARLCSFSRKLPLGQDDRTASRIHEAPGLLGQVHFPSIQLAACFLAFERAPKGRDFLIPVSSPYKQKKDSLSGFAHCASGAPLLSLKFVSQRLHSHTKTTPIFGSRFQLSEALREIEALTFIFSNTLDRDIEAKKGNISQVGPAGSHPHPKPGRVESFPLAVISFEILIATPPVL